MATARVAGLSQAPQGAWTGAPTPRALASTSKTLWQQLAAAEEGLRRGPTPQAVAAYVAAVRRVLAEAWRQGGRRDRVRRAEQALAEVVAAIQRADPAWQWLKASDRLRGLLVDLLW